MSAHGFKIGDKVRCGALRDGTVSVVGLGTIHADFPSAFGNIHHVDTPNRFRREGEPEPVKIGGFGLRWLGRGRIFLTHRNGEGMECDEAKLESLLERFWEKEF